MTVLTCEFLSRRNCMMTVHNASPIGDMIWQPIDEGARLLPGFDDQNFPSRSNVVRLDFEMV